MIVKFFEVRDSGTFIPVVAILVEPWTPDEKDAYLIRRSGWISDSGVILCRLECAGTDRNATYDCYAWGNRTLTTAHDFIALNWPTLNSGDVIDVQFILGETQEPKHSEREQELT